MSVKKRCAAFILLLVSTVVSNPTAAETAARDTADAAAVTIPRGSVPAIDGVVSEGEWSDAGSAEIAVDAATRVTVQFKHDGENLWIAFTGFRGELLRVPEVLIDAEGSGSASWGAKVWWMHASARDCWSEGRFNDYATCVPEAGVWEANNFARFDAPPEAIEMRVPFSLVGVNAGDSIGIAFNVTDTRAVWDFWPASAKMEEPASWARAVIE